ncbi:NAD(P)/FAD-dependent oxidoreductase [Roseateles saccharophilus]|nr:FAD-binding oxidoreductase [Roseateles saccharophilus]MDG0832903.1 FAD-binding oxidoreductase [Roseateles saccharophilus]
MSLLTVDRELTQDSYYVATAARGPGHAALNETLEADVAIVGGGLAGLSAAIELAERGHDMVLLEAALVGSGASGRNGGQAIHGLACDPSTIEAQLGLDEARRIWAMSIEALDLIRERCARFDIDAEWQDGFLGLATSAAKAAELQRSVQRIGDVYDYPMQWIAPAEMPQWIASPRFYAGAYDARSGHLHPLKYSLGLARAAAGLGVRIFERSPVTAMEVGERVVLRTGQGQVRARQVLLAGNVYLPELAPSLAPDLAARIMPVGTYIGCTAPMAPERLRALIPSRSACCDTNFVLDYFRPTADHRLLYGGRVSYSTVTPRALMNSMRARLLQSFPQLDDVAMQYAWGGFVDISMNRAPDFGRVGPAQNVYYVQGFSGHGLALTGMAGRVVAEAMHGDATRFDTFARLHHRRFPGGRLMRTPALMLGMAYYRLKDLL